MNKFFFFLFLLNTGAYADTISMRADNWCPFNCDPKDGNPGYVVEILNHAFTKAGHKLDYQILAWNKAVAETIEGKHAGVIGALKEDLAGGVNANPIGKGESCFFVKTDSAFKYSGIASLKGKKIGVIKDYNYGKDIDGDIKANPANYDIGFGDNPLVLNIRKFDAGTIDSVIETAAVFEFTAKKEGFQGKFKRDFCFPADELYVSFSGKNPKAADYAKLVNSAMDELRASGELKKILDKYGLSDWK